MILLIFGILASALETARAPAEQQVLPATDILFIPGVTSFVPIFWPLLALIITVVIHEYGHGLRARSECGSEVLECFSRESFQLERFRARARRNSNRALARKASTVRSWTIDQYRSDICSGHLTGWASHSLVATEKEFMQ